MMAAISCAPQGFVKRQKMAAWKPTENQRAAARFARSHSYRATVTALTKAVGISRAAYYKWFRRPEFRAWWTEQAEMFFTFKLPQVYGVIFARAVGERRGGDMRAAEVFMKRFDGEYMPQSRQMRALTFEEQPAPDEAAIAELDRLLDGFDDSADDDGDGTPQT